jgi:hypothetical protein
MRTVLPLALALLATTAHASAGAAAPEFAGSVWEGQAEATRLQFTLVPDRMARVSAGAGRVIEITAQADGASLIRLLDSAGKVMHSASTPADSGSVKSFRYTVCGAQVTFASPEPAEMPGPCPAG